MVIAFFLIWVSFLYLPPSNTGLLFFYQNCNGFVVLLHLSLLIVLEHFAQIITVVLTIYIIANCWPALGSELLGCREHRISTLAYCCTRHIEDANTFLLIAPWNYLQATSNSFW